MNYLIVSLISLFLFPVSKVFADIDYKKMEGIYQINKDIPNLSYDFLIIISNDRLGARLPNESEKLLMYFVKGDPKISGEIMGSTILPIQDSEDRDIKVEDFGWSPGGLVGGGFTYETDEYNFSNGFQIKLHSKRLSANTLTEVGFAQITLNFSNDMMEMSFQDNIIPKQPCWFHSKFIKVSNISGVRAIKVNEFVKTLFVPETNKEAQSIEARWINIRKIFQIYEAGSIHSGG